MTDSKYFTTTKKGEIFELKSELNSDKKEKKREAVKKVGVFALNMRQNYIGGRGINNARRYLGIYPNINILVHFTELDR